MRNSDQQSRRKLRSFSKEKDEVNNGDATKISKKKKILMYLSDVAAIFFLGKKTVSVEFLKKR